MRLSRDSNLALEANLVSLPARRLLRDTSSAVVHSVFDQVVNLHCQNGSLLSLVSIVVGPQPVSLVVEEMSNDWREYLSPGDPILLTVDGCKHARLEVRCDRALVWDPIPDWNLDTRRLLQWMAPYEVVPAEIGMATSSLRELALGLRARQVDSCVAAANDLAGLGTGLTPTADDFLIGVIHALHMFDLGGLAAEIARLASRRTTTISAWLLRNAGEGYGSMLWHNLLAAIAAERDSAVPGALAAIAGVGHHSGIEALQGCAWACRILAN